MSDLPDKIGRRLIGIRKSRLYFFAGVKQDDMGEFAGWVKLFGQRVVLSAEGRGYFLTLGEICDQNHQFFPGEA